VTRRTKRGRKKAKGLQWHARQDGSGERW
jgi:hypothetical protein